MARMILQISLHHEIVSNPSDSSDMTIPSSLERISQGNIRTSKGHIVITNVELIRIQLIKIVEKKVRWNKTEKGW